MEEKMEGCFQNVVAEAALGSKTEANWLSPSLSRGLTVHQSPSKEGDSWLQKETLPGNRRTAWSSELPRFLKEKKLAWVGFPNYLVFRIQLKMNVLDSTFQNISCLQRDVWHENPSITFLERVHLLIEREGKLGQKRGKASIIKPAVKLNINLLPISNVLLAARMDVVGIVPYFSPPTRTWFGSAGTP